MMDFSLFTGIAAATLHVISGPDHLAAVTPLAIETRRKVWKIGLLWGLGHLSGMLLIGGLFLIFKKYIPLERISGYSEKLVGLVLIVVGLWALQSIFSKKSRHRHPHIHGGEEPYIHVHEHHHKTNTLDHHHSHEKRVKQHQWSSYGIGTLHGLAGIAHFILFLPVLGFESLNARILYIMGFALGTILAMTVYTFLLGQIVYYSKNRNQSLLKTIRLSGSILSIAVGMIWLYLSF